MGYVLHMLSGNKSCLLCIILQKNSVSSGSTQRRWVGRIVSTSQGIMEMVQVGLGRGHCDGTCMCHFDGAKEYVDGW